MEFFVYLFIKIKATGPIFGQNLMILFALEDGPSKKQIVKD